MKVETVTITCDGCGGEDIEGTSEHTLRFDRRRRVRNDLCPECRDWVTTLVAAGRPA